MWRVPAPTRTAAETFELCVRGIRNLDRRERLLEISDDVVAASDAFEDAARIGTVATLRGADPVGQVAGTELSWLYTQRFARQGSAGRAIYDEIKSAAVNGRCPLCGHRGVTTLDHYLPKTWFPALAVAPANLVPACSDCNKLMLDSVPRNAAEVMLHPYFDDVEAEVWLVAEVLQTSPASLSFSVSAPARWPDELVARVTNHFEVLELSELYAAQAADELVSIRHALVEIFRLGGAGEVADHLAQAARSRRAAHVNSWKAAMYTAVAGSAWFCGGGFALSSTAHAGSAA